MSTSSIEEIEEQIVDEFNMFDDWMQKYEYIIDLGKNLPLIDHMYKDEEHIVKGCKSKVWLNAEESSGRINFTADSDAIITKGLIALLIRVLSNQKPEDIANARLEFLNKIGMKEHLSPNRANGLIAMIDKMKKSAKSYLESKRNN